VVLHLNINKIIKFDLLLIINLFIKKKYKMDSEDNNQNFKPFYNTRLQSKLKSNKDSDLDSSSNQISNLKLPKRTWKVDNNIDHERANHTDKNLKNDSIAEVLKSLITKNNNVINIFNINDSLNHDDLSECDLDSDEFSDSDTDEDSKDDNVSDDSNIELDNFLDELEHKNIYYSESEIEYLKTLNTEQRNEILKLETKLHDTTKSDIPLRFRILKLNIKEGIKWNILNMIEQSDSNQADNDKYINWVNYITKIPFDIYHDNKINSKSDILEIRNYLVNARKTMDESVYGHSTAKTQIISLLSKEISNPSPIGNVIAIKGPMGNGKTTLIKNGICKALNRPFAFIALGGMKDSSSLTGFEFTYSGSKPGRIIEVLIETKCMNPVIYFDELDKVSDSGYGQEIINTLIHLTDPSQNKEFHDKYFSGIDFDLSRATLIFSYNDENLINPILLDRMIKIKTDDFTIEDKVNISKNYLLPSILLEYGINNNEIIISDEVIKNIINNNTNSEKGVRNLRRCLDTIVSKINIFKYLQNNNDRLVNFDIKNFKLPYEITLNNLKTFLVDNNSVDNSWMNMYL
jgi:ATP-dependent Lon protease